VSNRYQIAHDYQEEDRGRNRFVATQDDAAFRALLSRRGPMDFRMCRRVLPCDQDAEDAFQTFFLVLARSVPPGRTGFAASRARWLSSGNTFAAQSSASRPGAP
jgi:hypothetical protein